MSACCRIGGAPRGAADAEQVEALTRYGLDIGIAFQISDDSLDFVADQDAARQGGRRRPAGGQAHAAAHRHARAGAAGGARAGAGPAQAPRAQTAEIEEIRRLVVKHEGVEYALEPARRPYAQAPRRDLEAFAPSEEQRDAVAGRGLRRRSRSVSAAARPRRAGRHHHADH